MITDLYELADIEWILMLQNRRLRQKPQEETDKCVFDPVSLENETDSLSISVFFNKMPLYIIY